MNVLRDAVDVIRQKPDVFREALWLHVRLSLTALLLAVAMFCPVGVACSRSRRFGPTVVAAISSVRVVPSLAVLFLLFPYRRDLGNLLPFAERSFVLALIALILLAGPPLIINTDAGLRAVDRTVLDQAKGIGMTPAQVFRRVHLPLALPVMITGARTAAVEVIASATLAAFVGAGGLGKFILSGLTLVDTPLLLVGALPVSILALSAEVGLSLVERWVTPPQVAAAR